MWASHFTASWGIALIIMALLTAAACGGSKRTPPEASPTPTQFASLEEWLAAPSTPPSGCVVSSTRAIRPDIGPASQLGLVYVVAGLSEQIWPVNPRDPGAKVAWVVDAKATGRVTIESRSRDGSGELLFSYKLGGQDFFDESGRSNLPYDQVGARQLVLEGPFSLDRDAARGLVIPTGPGCYDFIATASGETASATIYIYGDCFPPCP